MIMVITYVFIQNQQKLSLIIIKYSFIYSSAKYKLCDPSFELSWQDSSNEASLRCFDREIRKDL